MSARDYDSPVILSDAQAPLPDGGGVFPFTICTTIERFVAMFSVLAEGGAALGYGYIGDHNIDILAGLSGQPPDCLEAGLPDDATIDDLKEQLRQALGLGCGCDDCDREEDEMKDVTINGVTYWIKDCGCGDSKLYPLNPAVEVEVGSDGSIVIPPEADDPPLSVKAEYIQCVADAAVPMAMTKCADYQSLLVELVATTIDVFTLVDEWLDVALLTAAYLRQDSDLADIANFVQALVESALSDATYQADMIAHFADVWDGGHVSRQELDYWASKSVAYVSGVPVRWILRDWVKYANMEKFNHELALIAAACEGETDYDPDVGPQYEDIEQGGVTYRVWDWTLDHVLDTSGEEYTPPDIGATMVALAAEFDCEGVETDNCQVRLFCDVRSHVTDDVYQGNTYYRMVATAADNVNAEVIVENLTPDDYIYLGANLSTATPGIRLSDNGGGNQIRIKRVIALSIVS